MRVALLALSLLAGAARSASYDVIIVGSGPGGLVAAEFLTRETDLSVLMLEAGPLSLQASGGTDVVSYAQAKGLTKFDVPGEFDMVAYNPENEKYRIDWISTPYMWLGKLLGGCSSINAALYFRTADSFVAKASWPFTAEEVAKGYDEIEEIFTYTETPSTDGKAYLQEAYEIVGQALKSAGYAEAPGSLNAAATRNSRNASFGHPPYAIKDGLRDAPAKTFFSKLKDRANFKLVTEAKVSYVQQSNGVASGVVYEKQNQTTTELLTARGVVVMAAGALNTPAILMQSGIGPLKQLQTLASLDRFPGVAKNESSWVVNENVGQHVFDATVVYASLEHPKMTPFLNKKRPADAIAQYAKDQSGPWATSGPVLVAYESVVRGDREFELQTSVLPHGFSEFYETPHALTLGMFLNNPLSRDFVSFSSTGALQVATNGAWYGSQKDDVDVLSTYVAKMITSMTKSGATFLDVKSGNGNKASGSSAIAAWAATKIGSVTHHFGGSCFSATANVTTRCADEAFRVVGTTNVFVSDASLMKEGSVNPYGFVMYIGNQAGKNILRVAFNRSGSNEGGSKNSPSSSPSTSSEAAGVWVTARSTFALIVATVLVSLALP